MLQQDTGKRPRSCLAAGLFVGTPLCNPCCQLDQKKDACWQLSLSGNEGVLRKENLIVIG
ncbi:MAG: hypothetical protein JRC87_09290 [Deltaproteobacteria bacterium]|nr:hypothetical protein [Deltaproteobacteria bacterium]